jgi:ribonuclease HI
MHSADRDTRKHLTQTQRLNRAVDEALRDEKAEPLLNLLEIAASETTVQLCDRIARRANRLVTNIGTQAATIIAARNRRVLEVYARRAPKSWFRAWCDGSSTAEAGRRRAGIGVVLMNPENDVIAALGEPAGALSPLDAELAAFVAAMKTAVARGARYLLLHTDCPALVHLWQDRRDDDRLAGLREAAKSLRRLQLRLVPRRFNQVANALARGAVCRPQGQTDHVPHWAQDHSKVGNDRS